MRYTHTTPRVADHLRLSRGDTRSMMIKSESTKTPPAPMPCTVRPKSAVPMSPATPVTSDPMLKRVKPVSNIVLRPRISAKAENNGMKAVAATRKEMPTQKVFTDGQMTFADGSLRATAMVCSVSVIFL